MWSLVSNVLAYYTQARGANQIDFKLQFLSFMDKINHNMGGMRSLTRVVSHN